MSRRVRRRAILSCKPKSYTPKSDMIVNYWYNHLQDDKPNQEPAFMLAARNFRQEIHNRFAAVPNIVSVDNLNSVSKSRAMGLSEMTEEEMLRFNPTGTVTGRLKSNEPNKGGECK